MNTPPLTEQQVRQIVQQEMQQRSALDKFSQKGKMSTGTVTFSSVKPYTFTTNFEPSVVLFYGTPYHTLNGNILTVSIAAGGTGYRLNDFLSIDGGTAGTAKITGVSSGVITSVSLASAGSGYGAGTNTTTSTSGYGSGATVTITTAGGTSTDIHSLAIGQASLGKNLFFQPSKTAPKSSVITGGQFSIVQSCSSMYMYGSGNTTSFAGLNDQTNLIYVASGTGVNNIVAKAQITGYNTTSFTVTVKTLASGWTIIGNYFVM